MKCLASNRIVADGLRVGRMYREPPGPEAWDSGWRFFHGDESDAYTAEAANFAIYDINTIANQDPSILPYLDAPVGAAFERTRDGAWISATFYPADDA